MFRNNLSVWAQPVDIVEIIDEFDLTEYKDFSDTFYAIKKAQDKTEKRRKTSKVRKFCWQ